MNYLQRMGKWLIKIGSNQTFSRFDAKPKVAKRARITTNQPFDLLQNILPTSDAESDYWKKNLTPQDLINMPTKELQQILPRISDAINKAWWDAVIFIGSSYEVAVYQPGTDKTEISERGIVAINEFIERMDDKEGLFLNVVHRIISGGFMRGSFAAELVLDKNGRFPLYLATPDPQSFQFVEVADEELGQIWEIGQFQNGRFVNLSIFPTVKYIPILPQINSPYGVSWMEAAIFPAVFLLLLLQDTRRVIANYGYPREDIIINVERLMEAMPQNLADDPQKVKEWVDATIDEIALVISSLEPEDAWVHTDDVTRESLKGALAGSGANFAGELEKLINSLERLIVRGLKTMPFLLASRQSTTERQATIEWEAYKTGIEIIQNKLKKMLESLFNIALEVQGIPGEVVFTFKQIEISDPLVDAQTESQRIQNAIQKRNQGWIDNDQASIEITGSEAISEPIAATFEPIVANNNELINALKETRNSLINEMESEFIQNN